MSPLAMIIGIIVVLILLFIKSVTEEKKGKEKRLAKIQAQYGKVPEQSYSADKYRSLTYYYSTKQKDRSDIDEITWNDLDMDQIFMTMNNTGSAAGEEYLYALLHTLSFSAQELKERDRVITFFAEHKREREQVAMQFHEIGKEQALSVYEYLNLLHLLKRESNLSHYLSFAAMVAAFASVLFVPVFGVIAILTVGGINAVRYYKRKSDIEKYFSVVSHLIRLLDGMKKLSECHIDELSEYTTQIKETLGVFQSFRRGANIVTGKKTTGDLLEGLVDYVRMLFHIDLIKFNHMLATFDNHEKELVRLFEVSGFLDSMIAVASFRELMKEWCRPQFVKEKKIHAVNLYHPMLDEPVKASFCEDKPVLITGSNASGKSTFLKSLAINTILAQTVFTVMADSYCAGLFMVASSMALTDSIFDNESYYIVEIKSIKRILDRFNEEIPMLCFVDEVLRGTNTLERISASCEILYYMAKQNALCFAATHDIELTHLLEGIYSNYHFQESVQEDKVVFDYKLCKGRAVSKNAIRLLKMLGYNDEITERATARAQHFEEKNEWIL